MTDVLKFNADEFTLGDIEDFEEAAGMTFFEFAKLGEAEKMPVKVMKALVWIIKRREDPSFTLEQARDIKVSTLTADVPDPTPAELVPTA